MRFLLLLFVAIGSRTFARELVAPSDARQLVVVATREWGDSSGTLRRFARGNVREQWREEGGAVPVKIGRAGMAWGLGLHTNPSAGPRKIEGDKKAPAGVFHLTAVFGSDAKPAGVTLPYIRVVPGIEAVDDPDSRYYNRIVDRARIAHPDWLSSERMRGTYGDYRLGIVVAHNPNCQPRAGSCIFLHVWRNPWRGTSGCTAMPLDAIAELQRWLVPEARPVLMQAPREFLPPAFR